jgi:hypothetical protein
VKCSTHTVKGNTHTVKNAGMVENARIPKNRIPLARRTIATLALLALLVAGSTLALAGRPTVAWAAVSASSPSPAASGSEAGGTLEAAASKAGDTGRKVAMSLIGLAFAVAGIVLAFRRDFKEAAGVFAVGIVAVLLATPAGLSLLQDTVSSLFGSA